MIFARIAFVWSERGGLSVHDHLMQNLLYVIFTVVLVMLIKIYSLTLFFLMGP